MKVFKMKVKGVKQPRNIKAPSEEFLRENFISIEIEWIKEIKGWRKCFLLSFALCALINTY
jgi:hypothetical protein